MLTKPHKGPFRYRRDLYPAASYLLERAKKGKFIKLHTKASPYFDKSTKVPPLKSHYRFGVYSAVEDNKELIRMCSPFRLEYSWEFQYEIEEK